jgi:hypothetical protein
MIYVRKMWLLKVIKRMKYYVVDHTEFFGLACLWEDIKFRWRYVAKYLAVLYESFEIFLCCHVVGENL